MGDALKELFVHRFCHLLAEHAVCVVRGMDSQARELHLQLSYLFQRFLQSYVPMIALANHLCQLDDDWQRDTRRLWADLETMLAAEVTRRHQMATRKSKAPPKASYRARSLSREDPLGRIIMETWEALFSRHVTQGPTGAINPSQWSG